MNISLSGPAGSGKDTIASALQNKYGLKPMALAAPIKEIASHGLRMPIDEIERIKNGHNGHEHAKRMRKLLQEIGTECFRAYDENVWINNLLDRAKHAIETEGYAGVVVTDARFTNEFYALKRAGFAMVDVSCDVEVMRCPPGSPGYDHPSERDLDHMRQARAFDVTYPNVGTMEDGKYAYANTPDQAAAIIYRSIVDKRRRDLEAENMRGYRNLERARAMRRVNE